MRALTDSEARTIAALLGAAVAPERDRLARAAVPRSTYHAGRRKAYRERWLRDRYVPEPERFDRPYATFVIARPFADRLDELAERWQATAPNVVLLRGARLLLGVFLESSAAEAEARARGEGWSDLASSTIGVVADLHRPSVPVYFDFEGLWAHLTEAIGTLGYPRGLGGSSPTDEKGNPNAPVTDHQLWAAAELVHRPFIDPSRTPDGHLIGPLGLPFSQKRLVARGWVNHRVFMDPSTIPPYRANAADVYVFVTGLLKPGARPERLFELLVRECQVFPFLYVVGSERLLLGAMGSSTEARRAATSAAATPELGAPPGRTSRRSVMATLQESIQGIEILQEPAHLCHLDVDHRYDRILARRGGA